MPENSNQSKLDNYSLDFNGSTQFINTNYVPPADWFNNGFSISSWVYPTSPGNDTIIGSYSTGRFYFRLYDTNKWWVGFGNWNDATTVNNITSNEWQHVGLTYTPSDTTIRFYRNGLPDGSIVKDLTGLSMPGASYPLFIGANNQSVVQAYFSGKIGPVSLFDYALSENQIKYLYNNNDTVNPTVANPQNPMAIPGSTPIAYYDLGGSSTGDAAASSPNTLTVPNSSVPNATVFNFTTTSSPYNKITVNNLSVLNQSSKLSFSGWINLQDVSRFQNILNIFDTSGVNRIAVNTFNNNIRFNVNRPVSGNSYNELNISSYVGDGDWFHFAAVFDGTFTASPVQSQNQGRLKFYINGQNYVPNYLSGSVPSSIGDLGSSSFLEIGNNFTSQPSFLGMASNIAFWNTNLSPSEIETLYNNGSPYLGTQPQAANLKGWWRMNVDTSNWDGSDWTISDTSVDWKNSLGFDGASKITTPLDISNSSFTTSVWVKANSSGYASGGKYVPFNVQSNDTNGVNRCINQLYNGGGGGGTGLRPGN
jgi:hypothetical protein